MAVLEFSPTTFYQDHPYSEADFDGYQAAPLLIIGEGAPASLQINQDRLAERFVDVVHGELSPIVKESVVHFVARSIVTRMHQREGLNSISYLRRLHKRPHYRNVPELPHGEVRRAWKESLAGDGSAMQKHITRRALGMGSIELANITEINTFRKHLEPFMWDEISEIVGRDVSPLPEDIQHIEDVKLRIHGFDRDIHHSDHIGAVRIGMKRVIDTLDDGTVIKARTSAIINTSPSSGFDQSVVELLQTTPGGYADLAELPEFQRSVMWLIHNEVPPGIVLARNETVYEHNPQTRAEIERRRN